MWEQEDYEFHGEHFEVPYPHNILPEAVRQGTPADLDGVRQPAVVRSGR